MIIRPHLYQRPELITVFGGSGFVGRQVVETLTRRGYRVRVAVRRPERAYYMQQIGEVGQIQMLKTNVRIRESVARALISADAAVFLPGVLYSNGKNNFKSVLIEGARNVAEFAASIGIPLIHISALNTREGSSVPYITSKYEGEKIVKGAHPEAIILRPSIIFGPGDNFFNKFSDMARFSPILPLFGGGKTKFQPVYVGDVAEMVVRALDGTILAGRVYELGGPEVLMFRELMEEILSVIRRRRAFVSVSFWLGRLIAGILDLFGKIPLVPTFATTGQIDILRYDSIVSKAAICEGRTLEGVGIKPQGMGAILASYLWRFRVHGQFSKNTA
ncbi:MAG: 3-beta hydroxysteroid dehydrogenase [Candidatus Tokpelaia sp. JSC189]|nr:MAG: 3-beta hydroxysteroid dehydrogenase [Candidatus Tokpelaia sp. JSC189]